MQPTQTLETRWTSASLIVFRFIFVYFVIYIIPFPFRDIPFANFVLEPFRKLFFAATEQFGKLIFSAAYVLPPELTGSGDTMHQYVQLLLMISITLPITVVWTAIDRKRTNYDRLFNWFMILLRYYLAVTMLSYGFAKFFRTQFPALSQFQLNRSYGDSSPMGLLWTFMGYSAAYSIFAGMGEVIGGILLFFRRTRLLGALIVAIVMSHVVMLNLTFDVPVKLFSTHLLIIAILITSPDWQRLMNFFVLNKTADPQPAGPLYNQAPKKWVYIAAKAIILCYLFGQALYYNLAARRSMTEYFASVQKREPSMDGTYSVGTFIVNGDTLPPTQGDTRRWKQMKITGQKIELQNMDGASISWHFLGNVGYGRMVIHSTDLSTNGTFEVERDSTRIILQGMLHTDTLKVVANRQGPNDYPLLSRGFHWVNEYPYNR